MPPAKLEAMPQQPIMVLPRQHPSVLTDVSTPPPPELELESESEPSSPNSSPISTSTSPSLSCLLYTSDAADEEDSVDIGGGRIIKKKKKDEQLGVHSSKIIP
eukprot:TRINITY_DN35614_c0_g1_i1.p3 TRINITY_DN35614_c0_g1~~TRINITY_DN35614_c0_g1_i1.p3  ORF type:complete len:103 (-),score=26.60 TRINITY_DN35614_c0_g1_i1:55-363(-)